MSFGEILLCISMAGSYSRFTRAGYRLPKFLLPFAGGTVLKSVSMCFNGIDVVYVAHEKDRWLEKEIRRDVPDQSRLLFIDDTNSQSETVAVGLELLGVREHRTLFIHNIDTIVEGRDLHRIADEMGNNDGVIDVFKADSERYSYVRLDDDMRVIEIQEKKVISGLATSGLYGFRSVGHFVRAYRKVVDEHPVEERETYISDLYSQMIIDGRSIIARCQRESDRTIVLGTPEEYEGYLANI